MAELAENSQFMAACPQQVVSSRLASLCLMCACEAAKKRSTFLLTTMWSSGLICVVVCVHVCTQLMVEP